MGPDTPETMQPASIGKSIDAFSFPPLRLEISKLKDEHGNLRFKRLCFQFLYKDGEFVLAAYELDKNRKWIGFEMNSAKKEKGKIDLEKDLESAPDLIFLERDPDAAFEDFVQLIPDDFLFTQLEMTVGQIKRAIDQTTSGYLRFKPKPGKINPTYVSYDVALTETANPCPPAPPPDDAGTATGS